MVTVLKGKECVGELATNAGLKELMIYADSSLGDDFTELKNFLDEWGTTVPKIVAQQAMLAANRCSGDNKTTFLNVANILKNLDGTVSISAS